VEEAQVTQYPVFFAVARPPRFDRVQLALRVLLLGVLSLVGLSMGGVFALAYLVLPVLAAVQIQLKGPARYLTEDGPRFSRGLRALVAVFAYVALLTDRLPEGELDDGVQFGIESGAWRAVAAPYAPSRSGPCHVRRWRR